MALIINKFLGVLILFGILISCNNTIFNNKANKIEKDITIHHNDVTRESVIIYELDGEIVDSLKINDYYNSAILTKYKDFWRVEFKERCGSDCSLNRLIVLSVKNKKLIESLNLQNSIREYYINEALFDLLEPGSDAKLLKNSTEFYTDSLIIYLDVDIDTIENIITLIKHDSKKLEKTVTLKYHQQLCIFYNGIEKVDGMFNNSEDHSIYINENLYNACIDNDFCYFYFDEKWIEINFEESRIY